MKGKRVKGWEEDSMGRVLQCIIGDISLTPRTLVKPELLACVQGPSDLVERWKGSGEFQKVCRWDTLVFHNVSQSEACPKQWLRIVLLSPHVCCGMCIPTFPYTLKHKTAAKQVKMREDWQAV